MWTSVTRLAAGLILVSMLAACRSTEPPQPAAAAPIAGSIVMPGLSAPVRVVRDHWGVPHIYAATRDDLFFAQGFVQAGDRLFQMDLWRRSVQGRLAEVLGSNFIGRDAMTRRIQYHGSFDDEWASYGPDTRAIIEAFVRGINAWVSIAREHPSEEFLLAGWRPELWRPEDLLNRTDAFLASGDASRDVLRARLLTAVGASRAATLLGEGALPAGPPLADASLVSPGILDALRQIGAAPFFAGFATPRTSAPGALPPASNAWAVMGPRSTTGAPLLATDPHRALVSPSLRYLVHLTAPGWNVAGATAPWLPGVAIGHNDRVAWGMTAANADAEDIYVERINPENPHEVGDDRGGWTSTTVVMESLWVKGRSRPVQFYRESTPHGVIVALDSERQLAYALRWSGSAPGTAGELAATAIDRADSASALRTALARWKMPAVTVVYATTEGIVGSQVAALVPVRHGWDGRLPAAGTAWGNDWAGWKTLDDLPHEERPASGYVADANGRLARTTRLRGVLGTGGPFAVQDFTRLQHDVVAPNAQRLVPLLAGVRGERADVEQTRQQLLGWNRTMAVESREAAVYAMWERFATRILVESRAPADLVDELAGDPDRLVAALVDPSRAWFDGDPVRSRNALIVRALGAAVDQLSASSKAGETPTWGSLHTALFRHVLALDEASRRRFDVGPFPRGGYAGTVMTTSGRTLEAETGASFAAVFDLADWDRSVAQNAPGQQESPASRHFADLAKPWAAGDYFPLPFSEAAVQANAGSTLTLVPH